MTSRNLLGICYCKKIFEYTKPIKTSGTDGQPRQSCARVSDWPFSIHNRVYIFPSVFDLCSDALNSEECQTKIFSILKCLLFSKQFLNFDCNIFVKKIFHSNWVESFYCLF